MKKVLIIGGSGTMGRYLCPILAEKGYEVHAIVGEIQKDQNGIRYFFANALDNAVLESFLKQRYDGVVDFMWYRNFALYESRYKMFLKYTDHYFALSSYRVYANSPTPLTEASPRLSEALDPADPWRQNEGYAQIKHQMEDLLFAENNRNWTILRPSIVYCPGRVPLLTWSKNEVMLRAWAKKKMVLPREALERKTTMIWGEDAAKMIANLMFLPEAKGEIYNIASSETLTWGEIAKHYEETLGLEIELCETEEFCRLIAGQNRMTWANNILYYDRLYNRSVDNSKVLRATGLKSEDLMPIRKGLTLATEGILPAGFTALDAFLEQNKK